jgi:citrate synthase
VTITETEVRKGLAGIYADTTAISMVNPETNSLTYRGYPVQRAVRELPDHPRIERPSMLAGSKAPWPSSPMHGRD